MNRIAGKIVMIARSATKIVAILRCRGARHSERMILLQPFGALVLQTDCSVELVVKGLTIHCLTCLAFHPQNTVCGHVGLNQRLPNFFQCGNPIHLPSLPERSCAADRPPSRRGRTMLYNRDRNPSGKCNRACACPRGQVLAACECNEAGGNPHFLCKHPSSKKKKPG